VTLSTVSKVDPSRYADTGFSVRDTPAEMNRHLFSEMMKKSGAERLIIGCRMGDTARELVWSGISESLLEQTRRQIFLDRFYGLEIPVMEWNYEATDRIL